MERTQATALAPIGFELQGRIGLDAVLEAACARYGLTRDELCSGSRQPRIARARAAVAWVAAVELGISGRCMAEALGVTPPSVSSALVRGRRAACADGFRAAAILGRVPDDPKIRKI